MLPTSIQTQQAPEPEREAISTAKKAKLRYHSVPSPLVMANKLD